MSIHEEREPRGRGGEAAAIRAVLAEVNDPEIPVLSVLDLGIVREIRPDADPAEVVITPTYSGCPAMDTIRQDIRHALDRAGYTQVTIRVSLSPAWTTAWLSEAGREKLRAFGIAPPVEPGDKRSLLGHATPIACPRCGASDTEKVSEFGSTACKALYRCRACLEPFDYFKCL